MNEDCPDVLYHISILHSDEKSSEIMLLVSCVRDGSRCVREPARTGGQLSPGTATCRQNSVGNCAVSMTTDLNGGKTEGSILGYHLLQSFQGTCSQQRKQPASLWHKYMP